MNQFDRQFHSCSGIILFITAGLGSISTLETDILLKFNLSYWKAEYLAAIISVFTVSHEPFEEGTLHWILPHLPKKHFILMLTKGCQIRQDQQCLRNAKKKRLLHCTSRLFNLSLRDVITKEAESQNFYDEILRCLEINIYETMKLFYEWCFEVSRLSPQGVGNDPKANVGKNQKFIFCVYTQRHTHTHGDLIA